MTTVLKELEGLVTQTEQRIANMGPERDMPRIFYSDETKDFESMQEDLMIRKRNLLTEYVKVRKAQENC